MTPGATYHLRIVAVGEGGTGYGEDETFTTLPAWSFGEEGSPHAATPATSGPSNAPSLTASGIVASIAKQLTSERTARIGRLLRSGVFKTVFKAPAAGRAVIDWYYQQPALKRAAKATRAEVLVASGRLTLRAAGTAPLKISLTGAGRRLLSSSRRIRLTARCLFTPPGSRSLEASVSFELIQ